MNVRLPFASTWKASQILLLSASVFLFNCKGKDGDPGPKGDPGAQGNPGLNAQQLQENGFINGTIKGTRRDGTAFTETFEHKYVGTNPASFNKMADDTYYLSLYRSNGNSTNLLDESSLNIVVENKGKNNQKVYIGKTPNDPYTYYNNYLRINRVLPNNQLFLLSTTALFEAKKVLLPVSKANNATYKFENYGQNSDYISENNQTYLTYMIEDGSRIYFSYSFNSEYQFAFLVDKTGARSTTSEVYGNLKLVYKNVDNYGTYAIYNGNTDISEIILVPADTQEITNFQYNAATGLVTFDYKMAIQQFRLNNTTRNSLEITGSVSAKVYDSTVMRVGNE